MKLIDILKEIQVVSSHKLLCLRNDDEDGRFRLKVVDPRFKTFGYLSLALTETEDEFYFQDTHDLLDYKEFVIEALKKANIPFDFNEQYDEILFPKDSIQIK